MAKLKTMKSLFALQNSLQQENEKRSKTITMCGGTGCQASGVSPVMDVLQRELDKRGLSQSVRLRMTGCHGFCEQGPVMVIDPENIFYCHITAADIPEIISQTIQNGTLVDRLLYTDPVSGNRIEKEGDIPFYRSQERILLEQNKRVDPESIDDYLALGGYGNLAQVLDQGNPEEIIAEISASGLRGRGGGGYPTGRKWQQCRSSPGDEKYVICNADEGDPGAYMDRSILEGNPHLVLEGMLIGAYAIGAQKGYIYVRNEYPLAVKHARMAVQQARDLGLLGENILGTSFGFDITIARGGGAFVCGESTALMASLQGKVGEPRPKDVHTVQDGLHHKPTALNNVETWANVPFILKHGAQWFAAKGTDNSKGTKIFALTGKVKNTGLVEVPFGTTLNTIIHDIGGGAPDGKTVKAVQTGGPSGGCLPAEKFDLTVDFDTLYEAGSMVGSGGMVVMDERTCMVDVAKYFLEFLQDESCGKCVPCRVGISRMLEIVNDIAAGRGRPEQLTLLEDLAETVSETSLCALGKTAPNPVLSTLQYFREEYEAHIREQRCPAGVCRSLIRFEIDDELCKGCQACVKSCPQHAITGDPKSPHVIDTESCRRCGICVDACKFDAIKVA